MLAEEAHAFYWASLLVLCYVLASAGRACVPGELVDQMDSQRQLNAHRSESKLKDMFGEDGEAQRLRTH